MPSVKLILRIAIAALLIGVITWISLDNIGLISSENKKTAPVSSVVEPISSPYITEYLLPKGTWPSAILVDKNGIIWTVGAKSHTLFSFDQKKGEFKSYPISEERGPDNNGSSDKNSLMSWTMVEDNDGFIWFSQFGPDPLWRFDPHTEKFSAFHSISAAPFQMKVDKKTGNIWFTTLNGNTIGIIQKTENKTVSYPIYKITEFPLGNNTDPSGLFLQGDSVWVSEILKNRLARFTAIQNDMGMVVDIVKNFEIPSNEQIRLVSPTDLLVSSNGTILLTEHGGSFLTKYKMDSQNVRRFPTSQNPYHTTTLPFWMSAGSGDNLWFNEHTGNRIASFNTTDLTLTEYEIPIQDPSKGYVVYPLTIAVDPTNNNRLWFVELYNDKIGMVDGSLGIPFDIHTQVGKVELSTKKQNTTTIDFKIIEKNDSQLNKKNDVVSFKTSSSMTYWGELTNMTARFSVNSKELTPLRENSTVHLFLENYSSVMPGNYTLGISATDGMAIKSIFMNLEIDF